MESKSLDDLLKQKYELDNTFKRLETTKLELENKKKSCSPAAIQKEEEHIKHLKRNLEDIVTFITTAKKEGRTVRPSKLSLKTEFEDQIKKLEQELQAKLVLTTQVDQQLIQIEAELNDIQLAKVEVRQKIKQLESEKNAVSQLAVSSSTPTQVLLKDVQCNELIGKGASASVYKGLWNGTTIVALKHLTGADDWKAEVSLLSTLNHPNIVRYFGLCTINDETYIVTEYVSKGSLLKLIDKTLLPLQHINTIACYIAAGMAYLEQNNVFHRDLACRNVLCEDNYVAKIADFGLSRRIPSKDSQHYYSTEGIFPIRWTAPECIASSKFDSKSDVWSFGVVLWVGNISWTYELTSGTGNFQKGRGSIQLSGISNTAVLEKVQEGLTLSQPPDCPNEWFQLMTECWNLDPAKRPTFKQLFTKLNELKNQNFTMNSTTTEPQAQPSDTQVQQSASTDKQVQQSLSTEEPSSESDYSGSSFFATN